jgi:hypothetical protein
MTEGTKMAWEGAVSAECLEYFTDEQITELCHDLDEAIHTIVDKHWAANSLYDPIIREKFIQLVGLETATEMMENVE